MKHYQFKEETLNGVIASRKYEYTVASTQAYDGKYGRLNMISILPKEEQPEAMLQYKREEEVGKAMFPTY